MFNHNGKTLQQDEVTAAIKPLIPILRQIFSQSPLVQKYLHNDANSVRLQFPYDSLPLKISNLTLRSYRGNMISLRNVLVNNNYTLIDFWASWCAPCKTELHILSKAHHLFKDKGFQILSVSIGKEKYKDKWSSVIEGWVSVGIDHDRSRAGGYIWVGKNMTA